MSTTPHTRPSAPSTRPAAAALGGALGFVACYLAVDLVAGRVATSPLPLPGASAAEVYAYMTGNPAAVALTALCQLASVAGLLVFVLATRRALGPAGDDRRARWAQAAGVGAVLLMVASSALALVLAATASTLSVDTVVALRTASFLTGGVLHVMSLGVFVWLTRTAFPGRGIRVLGAVAAVPALLSVASLIWFYASVLILLGRLLCMVWTVASGVAMVRRAHAAIG
jgi:hypothetical protein